MTEKVNFAFIGASSKIGRSLRTLGLFDDNGAWLSRSASGALSFEKVSSYEPDAVLAHTAESDVLVILAANTRDADAARLNKANVAMPTDLTSRFLDKRPDGRVIYLSSDLAAYTEIPYGASKEAGERSLLALGGDVICLRLSMVACLPPSAAETSLAAMAKMAGKPVVPLIGNGRFDIRPLWAGDLAAIIQAFGTRRGSIEDRGCWSVFGGAVMYRDLISKLAAHHGNQPIMAPVPILALRLAGNALQRLNPKTGFPIDFLNAVAASPRVQPPDAFQHLGLQTTQLAQILEWSAIFGTAHSAISPRE